MEIVIVLLLIVLNGIFSMAEIAIVSSRKSRLQQQANEGNKNAQAALDLAHSPNRFLSTVQIGITFVGIFAGAFGAETIAENLAVWLGNYPNIARYSEAIALGLVVTVITYLSLVIGELVPKRLALTAPEKIAKMVARPMNGLSTATSPLVSLLSVSTDWIIRMLRVKKPVEPPVSEEEVKMLIREGARAGVFETEEKDIVERTLKLNDMKANSLMIPRKDIIWLDSTSSISNLKNKITKSPHSHFPVCEGGLDTVLGIVRTEDILTSILKEEKFDLRQFMHKAVFVPESMRGLKILELFKKSGLHTALVVDEYGNVQGLVSLNDVLEALVGDIPTIDELEIMDITRRDDGTWLVDGMASIEDFKEYFKIKKVPEERTGAFHTVGGLLMHLLGHIPSLGDTIQFAEYELEVLDMDGNRVDKILIKKTLQKE